MTYEEVISRIKPIAESSRAVDGVGLFEPKPITIALEMAIEALEKQIPKKLKYIPGAFYSCPTCGNGYGRKTEFVNHCFNCGQAILWEDTE